MTAVAAPAERQEGERIKASPLARRLAREQGIDLAAVSGTGPEGRIVAEDVERDATTAAPAAEPTPAPAPEPADRSRHRSPRRQRCRTASNACP